MQYLGEMISIGVAFSWTATALLSEFGSKRMGNLTLNVMRMTMALVAGVVLLWVATGSPVPVGVGWQAAGWMLLSGLVGYVIGDFCLFQCYIIIGSRYGQLFMTLAPLSAAAMAWVTLGEQMSASSVVAMLVTLLGISISVLGRGEHHRVSLRLPLSGVLFAVAAAMCQGIGLVLSKIGMEHFLQTPEPAWTVPFTANTLRCVAGLLGFLVLMWWRGEFGELRQGATNRIGLTTAMATTLFGPFLGVGFSLMAVQHTGAGIASTLMAMTPIIIILPSWWLFHERITLRSVLGAVISVIGVSLFFLA